MLEITFLGTSSAQPNLSRSHSSLALKIDGRVLLFDVGEGTQHRLIHNNSLMNPENAATLSVDRVGKHASLLKFSKIEKIFITHMHGDHVFGLPGLLCTISQNVIDHVIDIYGPKPIGKYIRNCLEMTSSRLGCKYRVHQFCNDITDAEMDLHPDELQGTNIIPTNNVWNVFSDEMFSIKAVEIAHSIQSFGFVLETVPEAGKLNAELLDKVVKQFESQIITEFGVSNPKQVYKTIKQGIDLRFKDNRVIRASDFLGAPKKSLKIVVLGDTCDPSAIKPIAMNATCIIHEATNAYLGSPEETYEQVKESASAHGHSTPEMAGAFASSINAEMLILNHFSSRYKCETSSDLLEMEAIRQCAVKCFKSDNVVCAQDYMTLKIR